MRLQVTRKADLAARALVVLAEVGGRLKAAELAELLGTSAGFISQVLSPLVEKAWVRSDPGPTGGYSIANPLESLSVLDVIETIDGPTDAGRCVVENRMCDTRNPCTLHHAWARARESLVEELRATSLVDVVQTGGRR
ncbi:MAG: Rrf2 family transcriptional regulator [Acidimicrobiia bacterium]|nr:Rrf2 family transcriptional regulator [Acidimicrobiia bacterium]